MEEEDKEGKGKRWGEGKMEREVGRGWDTADNKQHPFKDHSKDRGLPSYSHENTSTCMDESGREIETIW